MNFAKGTLRRMGLASTAVGAFMFAWSVAQPASAQSLNIPGLDGLANTVGGAFNGLWGKKDDQNSGPIDYRPRPALVVPPSYNLPPPQPHLRRSANWPKDPDAAALRRARVDSRQPAPSADSIRRDSDGDPMPAAAPAPSQPSTVASNGSGSGTPMQCSKVAGTPICVSSFVPDMPNLGISNIPGLNMIPGLGKKENDDAENIRLNPNPTRRFLTDPPVDYLEAVQLPQKGQPAPDPDSKQSVERAAPSVDRTPPGK